MLPASSLLIDLSTLLAVRLGIDALTALAFLALMRRYAGIGGPGWWALSAAFSIVSAVGIALTGRVHEVFTISVPNAALSISVLLAWMGLRSYLGLSRPLGAVIAAALAVAFAHVLFLVQWDLAPVRQGLLVGVTVGIAAWSLRDMSRADPQGRVPELRVLKGLVVLEIGALAGYAVLVPVMGLPVAVVLPWLMLFALFSKLLRVVVYGALVSYRLRQEADRVRHWLQTREADSHALIENLSAGVLVFRPDRTLASINNAARRFLGWSEGATEPALSEASGVDWQQLLREDGQPMRRHEMPFERVLANGQPVGDVVLGVAVGDDGDVRWALCNAYPENDTQGGLRHVVLTFVDISSLKVAQTQQKALQGQLAQSQKMEALGTLAGGVAHDFNNILAAILGNADLARQDLPPFAPSRESLHEISTAARRGRELVRQIMAFSRRQPMARVPVYMGDVLNESCSLLRAALPPRIELVHSCARGVPPILADATQLGQVLLNLGTNAIHALQGKPGLIECLVDELPAGHPGLPSELAQSCPAGAVRLRVRDSGCGMDEVTRSRIFEPFFTTKAVGTGTGLGLPVALGIVQSLGGAMDVTTAVGEGTTFSLFFPVSAARVTVSGAQERDMPPSSGDGGTMGRSGAPGVPDPTESPTMADVPPPEQRHILYLDDDDTLVFLVRRLLERRGYKVTSFTEQPAAIEAIRDNPGSFDLLLTDYNMPGMSGLDVARAVLAIHPALPVAVASGYITDELQAEALAAGVREVVFKTDAVEAFCDIVARLVNPRAAPDSPSPR